VDVNDIGHFSPTTASVLGIVFAILIILGSIVLACHFLFVKKIRGRNALLYYLGFCLVAALLGAAFFFHNPYRQFGFLPLMFSVFGIYLGFILSSLFQGRKKEKMVLLAFAAFYIGLTLYKLIYFKDSFVRLLPLNVCNVLIIFIILKAFFNNKVLDQYIVIFGIVAGLVNIFTGQFYDGVIGINAAGNEWVYNSFGQGFFYYRFFEATFLHNFFFTYLIYCLRRNLIRMDVKDTMKNYYWIVPYVAFFVFFNQIFKTDYFFTGRYPITPTWMVALQDLFPLKFYFESGGVNFEINILYYLFYLGLVFGVIVGLSWLMRYVQQKFLSKDSTKGETDNE
jgi:hypothetical protein